MEKQNTSEVENFKERFLNPENLKEVLVADDVLELLSDFFSKKYSIKVSISDLQERLQIVLKN